MNTKTRLLTILSVLAFTALACGQFDIGFVGPTPTATEIEKPEDTPTPEPETTMDQNDVRDENEKEDFSEYWVEVEDYRTGLRFAIPCFWVANVPAANAPGGLGSFSVNNFSEDFIFSLGPKRSETVWEIGGLKFDLGYLTMSEFNLASNATTEELAYALVNPDDEHGITSTIQVEIGGKTSLQVNTWSTFGEGKFYLLPFINELYILFGPNADHPDIQAILHSMVLDPADSVQLPTHHPSAPPEGMAAPCMNKTVAEAAMDDSSLTGTLDCMQVTEADSLMWVVCNVQDSFRSRNTQPLLGTMGDPFLIGYWQSEGVERTRDQALFELENNHMPTDTSGLTFTIDRNLFPPLYGMQPEQIFPPDANIIEVVYSEGWGQDGKGAALLYFADNGSGGVYFYGMVIAGQHFDR